MSISFYNKEFYPDPTAYEALQDLEGKPERHRKPDIPDCYPVDWKGVSEDENFAWEELANAVIFQAAQDWREARNRLAEDPADIEAQKMRSETEKFFRSALYRKLTKVDGEYLLERLKKEG